MILFLDLENHVEYLIAIGTKDNVYSKVKLFGLLLLSCQIKRLLELFRLEINSQSPHLIARKPQPKKLGSRVRTKFRSPN